MLTSAVCVAHERSGSSGLANEQGSKRSTAQPRSGTQLGRLPGTDAQYAQYAPERHMRAVCCVLCAAAMLCYSLLSPASLCWGCNLQRAHCFTLHGKQAMLLATTPTAGLSPRLSWQLLTAHCPLPTDRSSLLLPRLQAASLAVLSAARNFSPPLPVPPIGPLLVRACKHRLRSSTSAISK